LETYAALATNELAYVLPRDPNDGIFVLSWEGMWSTRYIVDYSCALKQ
jgi:hypothetical protein